MYFAWQQNADINIWSSATLALGISPFIAFILALHAYIQQCNHSSASSVVTINYEL